MNKIYQLATDPKQYDTINVGWSKLIKGLNDPSRAFYWGFISPYTLTWSGKNILDIGAGTGWLLDIAFKLGAKTAIGIEPSKINIKQGKKLFPNATFVRATLEEYTADIKFDYAIATYTLTNVGDLNNAFSKISSLLISKGEFIAIVPDYGYYKQPRFGYEIKLEKINDNEYSALVKCPQRVTADIIRRIEVYERAAANANMKLLEDIPIKPTDSYIASVPKYKPYRKVTIAHLLRFAKN